MAQTNKNLLISASSTAFQSGPTIESSLLPSPWKTVKDQYYKSMRRMMLDSTLDWGTQNHSIILPRSLNCVSNIYLRIQLPALSDASHTFKRSPGKYVLQSMIFRSNGQQVYAIPDYSLWVRNFEESLSIEELSAFSSTFMGDRTNRHEARTVFIPLALPQTRFGRYAHHTDEVKFGVLPMRLGNSVTEIQLTFNTADHTVTTSGQAPGSIQNAVSLEFREIVGRPAFMNSFSDGRASYSVCLPERIPLNADFENCGAGVQKTFKNINPTGNVFAIEFYVLPQGDHTHVSNDALTSLHSLEVRLDNELVISLDEAECRITNYSHGYRAQNGTLSVMPRINFNTQGAKSQISFRGSCDFRNIANCDITVSFKDNCKVRLYSLRYSRIVLTAAGEFKKYLD